MTIYRQNLINYWRQWYPEWDIPNGYHVHHIIPQSCGGSNHPSNLIALHPDDHVAIHKHRGDNVSEKFVRVGGKGMEGRSHTKETRAKMSKSKKGVPSHWKGKRQTKEHVYKRTKHQIGKPSKNKGNKLSNETRAKMSASKKGIPKPKTVCRVRDKKEMHIAVFMRWQ